MTIDNHELDSRLMTRARLAYELGRLGGALLRGALLALAVAAGGRLLVDAGAWVWAPFTFALWSALWWRGGALLTGARYGLGGGALTYLMPLSLLRPCCRAGMIDMAATCTMPEMCVMAGAVVGVPLSALVMRRCAGQPLEAAAGMVLGVLCVATVKCSALFMGEALGLLGGVTLGITAAAAINFAPRHRAG
ncbi:MAG TPA: hypothetical protein VFZ61_08855 [Polyangiales bacterium]